MQVQVQDLFSQFRDFIIKQPLHNSGLDGPRLEN